MSVVGCSALQYSLGQCWSCMRVCVQLLGLVSHDRGFSARVGVDPKVP